MKKFAFLFVVGLFLVAGCGSDGNKVVCKGTQAEDRIAVEMKMEASLTDGKVSSVSATMKIDNEETAQQFCSMLAIANSMTEDESGKVDYECNGKEIKIKNYEVMGGSEENQLLGLSKADFIKAMEEEALTCK